MKNFLLILFTFSFFTVCCQVNKKYVNKYIYQELQSKALSYSISDSMFIKDAPLINLILESTSIENKQEWFYMYNVMDKEAIKKTYAVFLEEQVLREFFLKANNGDLKSILVVSNFYLDQKNYNEALSWLKKAGNLGSIDAMIVICSIYLDDNYDGKDFESALFWLRKAARKGNQRAQETLRNADLTW